MYILNKHNLASQHHDWTCVLPVTAQCLQMERSNYATVRKSDNTLNDSLNRVTIGSTDKRHNRDIITSKWSVRRRVINLTRIDRRRSICSCLKFRSRRYIAKSERDEEGIYRRRLRMWQAGGLWNRSMWIFAAWKVDGEWRQIDVCTRRRNLHDVTSSPWQPTQKSDS